MLFTEQEIFHLQQFINNKRNIIFSQRQFLKIAEPTLNQAPYILAPNIFESFARLRSEQVDLVF